MNPNDVDSSALARCRYYHCKEQATAADGYCPRHLGVIRARQQRIRERPPAAARQRRLYDEAMAEKRAGQAAGGGV